MKWTVIHLSKPCKDIMHEQDLKSIRFDNETNFVGSNKSKKTLTEMDQEQISCYLLQNGNDWSIWLKIHLELHIWVKSGTTKFGMPGTSLMLYSKLMVIP